MLIVLIRFYLSSKWKLSGMKLWLWSNISGGLSLLNFQKSQNNSRFSYSHNLIIFILSIFYPKYVLNIITEQKSIMPYWYYFKSNIPHICWSKMKYLCIIACLLLVGLDLSMGVAVMSVDLGAEWMKIAVVSVSLKTNLEKRILSI